MKKIVLILCIILFVSSSLDSKPIQRTTSGGRNNGVGNPPTYHFTERVETDKEIKIRCIGSGADICPTSIIGPGPKQDAVQNAEDYANNQIVLNNLVGSHYFAATKRNVKWKATSSSFGSEREIITWSSGEAEPNFTI